MEEEVIVVLQEDSVVQVKEYVSDGIAVQEDTKDILVDAEKTISIDAENAFPALGQDNKDLNHSLLYGREEPNQHPISAIEGLREELDEIESLQTVYSDKKQQANYYAWKDENPSQENREGFFVSICPGTDKIQKCNDKTDVLGVIVANAGFVGGQEYIQAENSEKIGRDSTYGLVVSSGVVNVRCETNVAVGDYVVSNKDGIAAKSDGNYGYLVTAISDINGINYATISLIPSSTLSKSLADGVSNISKRMTTAESNIVSVTNTANSAYALARETKNTTEIDIGIIEDKIQEALEKVDTNTDVVSNLSNIANNASKTAVQAKAIAEGAINSAESIRKDAVETANNALGEVIAARESFSKTIDDLKFNIEDDIATFQKEVSDNYATTTQLAAVRTENSDAIAAVKQETSETYATIESVTSFQQETTESIAGVKETADGNAATIEGLTSWQGDTNSSIATLKQQADKNGAKIQALVVNVNKYSVGEYSQSYGLTLEQAQSILEEGTIYIPTVDHNESTEIPINGNGIDKISTEKFLKGYAYKWDGTGWYVSNAQAVTFSKEYVEGNEECPYWIVLDKDVERNGITYDLGGLYKWENGAWVKVASIIDNSISRAVSSISQKANEISAEVTDIQGDVASHKQWIDENDANIQDIVTWKNDNAESIATTIQSASDSAAYIGQIASIKNEDGTVNATASIVAAVNDSDSSVSIKADKIVMTGTTTFLKPSDVGEGGTTVIDGGRIITGTINADRIDVDNLKVKAANITGTLTIGQLPTNVAKTEDIPTDTSDLTNNAGFQTKSQVTTITQNTITTDYVNALNITALGIVTAGVIKSKNYVSGTRGLELDLTKGMADITGKITTKEGTIGGFTIKENCLYSGVTSMSDSSHEGVYIGTDGIRLGPNFYVDKQGVVTASGLVIKLTDEQKEELKGEKGDIGYSIVAHVSRPSFTEANWNNYGTVGHTETWSSTSSLRNGCRIGDIFTVVGTATDTKNAHVLYYKSTTASGDLKGTCFSHSIAERGAVGATGATGPKGADGKDGKDGVGISSIASNGFVEGDGTPGTQGNQYTITMNDDDKTTYSFIAPQGFNGSRGKEGFGIFCSSETTNTYTKTLQFEQITKPQDRLLQVGDLVIANPTYPYLYRIKDYGVESVTVDYIAPLRGAVGATGAEGIGIFHSTYSALGDQTALISKSTITVPSGRSLKVGDLVIANSTYSYLYRITAVGSPDVKVDYLTSLRGATGATGSAPKRHIGYNVLGAVSSATISHGLGAEPDHIFISLRGNTDKGINYYVTSKNQTSFTVGFYSSYNGNLKSVNSSAVLMWEVIR